MRRTISNSSSSLKPAGARRSRLSTVSVTSAWLRAGREPRAREDHVVHAVAAHRRRAVLAHHPAQRLEQVRLAAAVRADHAGQARAAMTSSVGSTKLLNPRRRSRVKCTGSPQLPAGRQIPGWRRELSTGYGRLGRGPYRPLHVVALDLGRGFAPCLAGNRRRAPWPTSTTSRTSSPASCAARSRTTTVLETEHTLAFHDIRGAGAGARAGDPEGQRTSPTITSAPRRATPRSSTSPGWWRGSAPSSSVAPGDGGAGYRLIANAGAHGHAGGAAHARPHPRRARARGDASPDRSDPPGLCRPLAGSSQRPGGVLGGRPEQAAAQDRRHLRHVELARDMAERRCRRPGPCRSGVFQTTGITAPSIHSACSPPNVVVASTSFGGSTCM